jgi:hypothetical protein
MRLSRIFVCAVVGVLAACAASASATSTTFTFERITSNAPYDIGSDLKMEVTDLGTQVSFKFTNESSYSSSFIAQVYLDDIDASPLLSSPSLSYPAGVQFSSGGNPASLPGGNSASPPFDTDARWSAQNPSPSWGVHPGTDYLTITFTGTYSSVITALGNDGLRFGLHVQGLPLSTGGTQSDSYVTVPEPLTMAGVLLGVGSLAGYLKRRRTA